MPPSVVQPLKPRVESQDDSVAASFIVMEKIPGKALDWNETTREQRQKIMEQLATISLELEKYPFKKTGSIVLNAVWICY
jgi:hypothetical protein